MRLTILAVLACLLAFPAAAGEYDDAPDMQEDGCIELGAKMDADAKEKRKPTAYEQEQFAKCLDFQSCKKSYNADDPTKQAAAATNESLIRFVIKTCSGYDPPKGGN